MTWALRFWLLGLMALSATRAGAEGFVERRLELSSLLAVSWEAGFPASGLKGFAGTSSPRGAQLEARLGVGRHLSFGLASSWIWFARNDGNARIGFPNAVVTGPVYRRAQAFTLRATGQVYLTDGPLQPYLGAGIGGVWSDALREAADLRQAWRGWGFAADPQVGLLYSLRPGLALHAQVRWQVASVKVAGLSRAEWLAADLGVAVY